VFPQNFLLLASLGNFSKAVGKGMGKPVFRVIQTHFAAAGNVGAVAAKEEVWEVSAQLVGYGLSVLLLQQLQDAGGSGLVAPTNWWCVWGGGGGGIPLGRGGGMGSRAEGQQVWLLVGWRAHADMLTRLWQSLAHLLTCKHTGAHPKLEAPVLIPQAPTLNPSCVVLCTAGSWQTVVGIWALTQGAHVAFRYAALKTLRFR
jgi:hypothetical protein